MVSKIWQKQAYQFSKKMVKTKMAIISLIRLYRSRSLLLLTLHFHASVSPIVCDDGQGLLLQEVQRGWKRTWTVGLLKDQDMEKIQRPGNTHSIFTTSMSIVKVLPCSSIIQCFQDFDLSILQAQNRYSKAHFGCIRCIWMTLEYIHSFPMMIKEFYLY